MTDTARIAQRSGDGATPQVVTDEDLADLKRMINDVRREGADHVFANRKEYENITLARWAGQTPDGRKHSEATGKKVTPFEASSDNRVRLVDQIISERVMTMTAATMRATTKFKATEASDFHAASKWSLLVKWLTGSYWAKSFRSTVKLVARWQEADTPAVSAMLVDWVTERRMEYQKVTPETLMDLYVRAQTEAGRDPGVIDPATIMELATNPDLFDQLQEFLKVIIPSITTARARKVAQGLLEEGEAEIPVPYNFKDGPELIPLRLFEDVFLPVNTTDPDNARVVFLRFWKAEHEIREMAATEGWNAAFVKELLGDDDKQRGQRAQRGHEGRSAFEEDLDTERVVEFSGESNRRTGLWEIITALHWATNADGVKGLYITTFSGFCKTAATKSTPFARKHGGMPIVWFKREELTKRLMDSRGVPELAGTDQKTIKMLKDSFEDHVQVVTLPPTRRPPGKPHYVVDISPLGTVESTTRDPVDFMDMPGYPQAADGYWTKVRRDLAEYWGRPLEEVPIALVQLITQDYVDGFLAPMSRVFTMALQLCQELMPDAMLQRVMGGRGTPAIRTRAEIQGQFDMALSMDVRDLDGEALTAKADMVVKYVKQLDNRARVRTDDIAVSILQAVDPAWADLAVVPADAADRQEEEEEKAAFVSMLNGTRAPMPEGGINAGLRLQVLEAEMAPRMANPAAYAPISAAAAALIQERMDYLEFQGQQVTNAETGRLGVDTGATDAAIAAAGAVGGGGVNGEALIGGAGAGAGGGGGGVVNREALIGGAGRVPNNQSRIPNNSPTNGGAA